MNQHREILFEAISIYNEYGGGTNFEQDLASKGMRLINSGRYKIVFAFRGFAVAIIPYERVYNFVPQIKKLNELRVDRDLFVYPFGIAKNEVHEQIFVLYELCGNQDVCDLVTHSQANPCSEQQVRKVAQFFTQTSFLRKLFSELKRLHNYANDNKGIFNFDIKFENLLVCGNKGQVKFGDIDGFGTTGGNFGVVTYSDVVSVFGVNDKNFQDHVKWDKRLGMLNDIFNIAFMFFFFKFYLIEKTLGIAYVNTMRYHAAGEEDSGLYREERDNKVEVKKSLHKMFYSEYNLRYEMGHNIDYFTSRMKLFWQVTKKFLKTCFIKFGKLDKKVYNNLKSSFILLGDKTFKPTNEFTEAYDGFIKSLLEFDFSEVHERRIKRRRLRVERVPLKRVKSYEQLLF